MISEPQSQWFLLKWWITGAIQGPLKSKITIKGWGDPCFRIKMRPERQGSLTGHGGGKKWCIVSWGPATALEENDEKRKKKSHVKEQ